MPRTKVSHSTLGGLIDSDSDDGHFVEGDSAIENMVPTKKGRGRPKVSTPTAKVMKGTKAKVPARRSSGRVKAVTKTAKAPAKTTKRKALADKTNQQNADDTEEVDEFEQDEDITMGDADELNITVVAPKEQNVKPTKTHLPMTKGKASKGKSMKDDEAPKVSQAQSRPTKKNTKAKKDLPVQQEKEIQESQVPMKQTAKGRRKVLAPEPKGEIQETQTTDKKNFSVQVDTSVEEETEIQETQAVAPMDIDHGDDDVEQTISRTSHLVSRQQSDSRPRQGQVQRRRAGSASDTERSDPALRRKLGEITKKFENLDIKYRDLREIGLTHAEREFDKLKKQTDDREKITKGLIASLKADVAAEKALSKEAEGLKKKVASQSAEMAKLQAKISEMAASLTEAQNENKALSTKLATSRSAAASVESVHTKVPGSAVKPNGGIRMVGSAEAAQVAQAAQLKEDLYSDLSGLIVRSVKRESEDDVFDCIQTGRNGTLHFKLSIANERTADSYDEAQCVYVPLLDPSRDKDLIDLLPDYLTEEITFPRPQAAKFYARVVKALTEN